MKLRPAGLAGSYLVDLDRVGDDRGFFARIWDAAWFEEMGMPVQNVQTNISYSASRGTVRGLHYQITPHREAKLFRCTRGAVFDVAVDMRPDSPTFRQWQGHVVDAGSRVMVFVPEGCAHGFQTLEDDAEVSYQVSHPYTPAAERGVRWDDPSIAVAWPITTGVIVSDKDQSWPDVDVEVPV